MCGVYCLCHPVTTFDSSRFAYGTFNVFVSCSALATAKQIVNPANYMQTEEAAKEASKQLPEWFAAQYKSRRMASVSMLLPLCQCNYIAGANGFAANCVPRLKEL